MQRVTIKDIAHLAGVSVTTVSRALNNAPEINESTKSKILRICREQGYRSNLLARSLVSNRSGVIGVVLPDIARPFYSALALHIETFAKSMGYQVMLCSDRLCDGRLESLFDFLISQRVDGVLLASANNSAHDLLCRYRQYMPGVLIGGHGPEASHNRISSVSCDNYVGGKMAAEYLHGLGHQKVIYLGYRTGNITHTLRHQGFLCAAERLGMEVEVVENPGAASTLKSGYQIARHLLLKPFEQTAIFAVSDTVALGVMQAADELGIAIPDRLSLLGFDNIDYAALPKIQLTTLDQSITRLAEASVQLLLEQIQNEDRLEYTFKLLTPRVVERSTCRRLDEAVLLEA